MQACRTSCYIGEITLQACLYQSFRCQSYITYIFAVTLSVVTLYRRISELHYPGSILLHYRAILLHYQLVVTLSVNLKLHYRLMILWYFSLPPLLIVGV